MDTLGCRQAMATAMACMGLAAVLAGDQPAAGPQAVAPAAGRDGADETQRATFAAGCFWGVEAAFRQIDGVISTRVGYTGGRTPHPTYRQVCSRSTGHAEAVDLHFDPRKVTYEQLLAVFWDCHDPTQRNHQGPDYGSQYRSAIFFHGPGQGAEAKASREALQSSGRYRSPIATQIVPAKTFWPAEEYHQSYLRKRGLNKCR